MPTRKNYGTTKSKKGQAGKSSAKRTTKRSAVSDGGPLPPYGNPIREAIARGDVTEMRKLATRTRRWIRDVQAALARLEKSIARLER